MAYNIKKRLGELASADLRGFSENQEYAFHRMLVRLEDYASKHGIVTETKAKQKSKSKEVFD